MKREIQFQGQPAVEIADALNRVIVSPAHGARILRWEKEGREVIRWPDDADWNRILKVRGGNPILFPFIARHFVDGRPEVWRDRDGTVRPMPQHGFARDAKFGVVEVEGEDDSLRMRLTDSEETRAFYPFSFQFDVIIALRPESNLEVRFETANPGTGPLPYYAGHHFYLAIPHDQRADWTLDLSCECRGRQAPDGSIRREPSTAALLRLDDPALIDRFQIGLEDKRIALDNRRTQQHLVFKIEYAGSVPWYAVTTWTETPTSDFYCVEPWLGLPNAIHHGEGLRLLAPGQSETATCVINATNW